MIALLVRDVDANTKSRMVCWQAQYAASQLSVLMLVCHSRYMFCVLSAQYYSNSNISYALIISLISDILIRTAFYLSCLFSTVNLVRFTEKNCCVKSYIQSDGYNFVVKKELCWQLILLV